MYYMNVFCLVCFLSIIHMYAKTIALRAGGIKGFYMMGVCKYIKDNYVLDNVYYYGASAGSWNALFMTQKTGTNEYIDFVKKWNQNKFEKFIDIENKISEYLLETQNDFDFQKLNVCVGVVDKLRIRKTIFGNFQTLEDVIDCNKASSHIPYLSSNSLFYKYKDHLCLDGGIYREPYDKKEIQKPDLEISYWMWNNEEIKTCEIHNINIEKMIHMGYEDTYKNRNKIIL